MSTILLGFAPDELDSATLEQIRALAGGRELVVSKDRAQIESILDSIEIAVGQMPEDLVIKAPNLRWFQQVWAGADWLLRYPEAISKDFTLTNASIHGVQIGEHAFGMLLMLARQLHIAVRKQEQHEWWRPQMNEVFDLEDKRMLLIGVGVLGERIAHLAQAFGMHVEGIRRNPSQAVAGIDAMYGDDQLYARLPHADVVVLTIPLSQQTRNMFGPQAFQAMKPSSILINVGRGGTVDEVALAQALNEGQIAGAGFDVFEEEPLPASSPLWDIENLIISSHYAGLNPKNPARAMAIFLDNLRRYSAGEPLQHVVDKQAGY